MAQTTTFTTVDGLAHDSIIEIVKDRQGDLWFAGTAGSGVFRTSATGR